MKKDSTIKTEIAKGIKNIRTEILLFNIALLLLGVVIVIFPTTANTIICCIVGILLCVWGVVRIVSYFAAGKLAVLGSFSLVQGVVLVGAGVYVLVNPEFLAAFLTIALAIVLLAGGAMKLQYAVDFMRMKVSRWWIELLGAVCMIVLGIVAFVNPFETANGLMMLLGISLIADAVWDIVSIQILSAKITEFKKNVNAVLNEVSTDDTITG